MRSLWKTVLCVIVLLGVGVSAYGQSFLEDSATRRISQETGIDQRLIQTLFIDDDDGQFILAFIYINEESVNGDLNPDIKSAMIPYVNRNALLVLVVPAATSFFDPFAISFVQNVFRVSIQPGMLVPVTTDFATGTLSSGTVSAGIIVLDSRVLASQSFEVQYNASYSTTFTLDPGTATTTASEGNPSSGGLFGRGGILRSILLGLLLLFLFPFLLI
jgi:hypothetical protein